MVGSRLPSHEVGGHEGEKQKGEKMTKTESVGHVETL